jgi:hypothetical protein
MERWWEIQCRDLGPRVVDIGECGCRLDYEKFRVKVTSAIRKADMKRTVINGQMMFLAEASGNPGLAQLQQKGVQIYSREIEIDGTTGLCTKGFMYRGAST